MAKIQKNAAVQTRRKKASDRIEEQRRTAISPNIE
jgi:hypothetical protein